MADACREYQSSLEDLTFNSKPHINMLTILAEENLSCASDIGAIIEAQISKAPSMEKLPVLYLVDSIVKNVGGEYTAVFAKNLITSFICVFDKVDENTRKSLFKLRSTWEEVFPLKKLYALDVRVNAVDPAWPIKPLPPTVNSSSIHVNPKFLKQSDEASSPQPAPAKPSAPKQQQQQQQPPPAVSHAPAPPHAPLPAAPSPSSLTQEQLIRQQLLAKQKQLLELQQKKIELELEQTKAQLAGGFVMPTSAPSPVNTPQKPPVVQPVPVVRPWMPSPQPHPHPEPKPPTRDPRLNRCGPPAKEPHAGRKGDLASASGSPGTTPEKPARPDRTRTPRKEAPDDRNKSKAQSPAAKNLQSKNKQVEAELQKSSDVPKKDPRLKKRPQEKVSGELNPEEQREKRRTPESKEAARAKSKLLNGSLVKHEHESVTVDKPDFKTGGNARTHARKRTRSRSRSPTAAVSPKRKDRRSPKSHGARSGSLSPSPSHKPGKARSRPPRPEEPKKNQAEGRRSKRPEGDRDSSHSPRGHEVIGKEGKDAQPQRWRSSWEENKHLKSPEEAHVKPSPLRHKPYGTPTRPAGPRIPKHRLSVDANMQIPEVLSQASKKDLLRRASKRLESGEISQEDFLNMAHQIKHFFQYQEEKQLQRSASWDPTAKPGNMDAAELTYYQHKSKLRKTQVMTHRAPGEEGWEGEESPEEGEGPGDKAGRPPPLKYNRPSPRDRQGERRSKEPEEPRAPLGPMIEEYNHGKEFPTLKSLPGLRFRRRADPRETKRSELRFWSASRSGKLQQGEREWTSPLTERQRYDEEQKSGYDAPRRFIPSDPRRAEALLPPPPPLGPTVHRNSPEAGLRFERERLSPLHQKDPAAPVELSPAPRFESPNSEHSDEGPMVVDAPLAPGPLLPPGGQGPGRTGPLAAVRHSDSPGHTPPHDALAPPRYEGPPGRANPPGWYEPGPGPGRYEDQGRFDGPPLHQQQQGPGRFDPPHHNMADRFEPQHMNQHMGRFDGPGRFDGHMNQQRFDGPMPRFNNNNNSMAPNGPMGFQQQRPMRFDGPPNQMSPMRFDGPGPMRFEGPGQPGPPRFDMPNVPQHFDCPPGQQNMMFGPQHGMQQPPMRPMAPPHYDGPMPPQQGFNMGPQRFPEPMNNMNPMNAPPFPQGPLPFNQPGNFNMQPGPFNQPGPGPFYNPQQPQVNMMNMNQPFLPQNQVPFGQQAPPVAPPENHFGQVDVNDLLSKLISTGIIKPSQPEAPPTAGTEPSPAAPAVPVAVEEEEEEEPEVEEDDDLPDLTGFTVDDMKLRYESVVTRLYSGNQCCLCSMRFTAAQTDLYADHLDWHFRQNHAGKTVGKKITHRRWYYGLRDWVEFEEIADLEERAKSNFFEKESEEEVQKSQAAAKEKEFQCVRAAKDQVGELCEICQEPFETYWVEEEEDWFLKNALRVDDKNFHPFCFEDYKNTSSYMDVSPSPSKLLTEHPLSAFIKTEEEEETTTSCCEHTVKQEAMSEEAELTTDIKTEEKENVENEEEEVLTSSEPAEENKL